VEEVGLVTALLCLISLSLGYGGARLVRLDERQAIASAMEVGIHNTTVALTIALSVLDSTEVAVPSAVYSVFMYVFATGFGYAITRGRSTREPVRA
jgi:BASS family bile acid:Na+ symporter